MTGIVYGPYHFGDIRTVEYEGQPLRSVNVNSQWMFVLKDISDIVGIDTWHITQRIPAAMQEKAMIETPRRRTKKNDPRSKGVIVSSDCYNDTSFITQTTIVSETGMYLAASGGRSLEARRFAEWLSVLTQQIRRASNIPQYEAIRMLDQNVQQQFLKDHTIQERFVENIRDIQYNPVTGQYYVEHMTPNGDVDVNIVDPSIGEIIE